MTEWRAEPYSPLGWASCVRCLVGKALVIEAWASRARCGSCLAAEHPPAPPSSATPAPVIGWRIGGRGAAPAPADPDRHPRPEWLSSAPPPAGWVHPSAVRSLTTYAEGLGWRTHVQYSRGYGMHGRTGAPLALSHLVAVRIGHHPATDRAAYSLYQSPVSRQAWTWKSHWTWGPDIPPSQFDTLEGLKHWLVDSVVERDVWSVTG